MEEYTNDYLLDKQIKIFQPVNGYRASSDAVLLSSAVQKAKSSDKILDLGSGTGAISLCLAHRFPKTSITGLEIQRDLVKLSNMSAAANGFDNLSFINCNIKNTDTSWFGKYDHVITNPPYSANDMPSPNQSKATAHNFADFTLSDWLKFALKCLRAQGHIYIINRAEAIDEILSVLHGTTGAITIVPLISKCGQNAKRVLICARKGVHTPTSILPSLIIHNSDGSYTDKAQKILRDGENLFSQF